MIHTVGFPVSTFHGPVVVAVIVHVALAVIQEAVLALLQSHGAVGALEVMVTQVRMRVRLDSIRFRAGGHMEQHSSTYWNARK